MDSLSRQNLTRLLKQADQQPVCVFTDLDKTSCLEGNAEYAAENKAETGQPACYMQPDIRRALTDLPQTGSCFYIVTGRHWADVRVNDVTGEKIPDGAFHDLLGGVKEFENASAVAGHGRLLVENGKTTVLRRSASEEDAFKEQKFERYVGENVLALKEEIFERWPEARGHILAEYKKHLSYLNLAEFMESSPEKGKEMFAFVDQRMKYIMEGKNPDGSINKNAPENPNGALFYTVEPTGSMEVRSKNQSKRNGVEKSGFLEKAFEQGGPVLVLGDSLAKNGTDRDMVEAVRDYFEERGAADRVFVIHVANGEKNRITDKADKCFPTITVKDPDELGQIMKMVAGHSRSRAEKETSKEAILTQSVLKTRSGR
ncbi:MAG: hypothetical protein J5716_03485 [Alphaproteobacteria bacterium]|nr:hypothetical protein [Alphaproteobacteria bacterium]